MTDEVKQQLDKMAQYQEEGIDTIASAVKDLYMVIDHLSNGLRAADIAVASMRHLLVKNKVLSDVDIDQMITNISEKFNKKMEDFEPDQKAPTAVNMQSELEIIHKAAKEAAETPYDADAFIFGG